MQTIYFTTTAFGNSKFTIYLKFVAWSVECPRAYHSEVLWVRSHPQLWKRSALLDKKVYFWASISYILSKRWQKLSRLRRDYVEYKGYIRGRAAKNRQYKSMVRLLHQGPHFSHSHPPRVWSRNALGVMRSASKRHLTLLYVSMTSEDAIRILKREQKIFRGSKTVLILV